ncbi:DUF1576 domain-containing protein [Culicoidibacter larvae]|nr:DUF1576 domain-containing protein [Culicoidibacter larvae]
MQLVISRDALVTDYIAVSGLSATLINVVLVMVFTLFIKRINHVELNGFVIAGLLTTMGFAFFGKNIYNILPIYLGVFLYARSVKRPFKQFFVIAMFATGLAPLVTVGINFGILGLIIGSVIAVGYGFIIPAIASHVIRFHNGYLLYNIGFSGGIVALILTAVLRVTGLDLEVVVNVNEAWDIHYILFAILIGMSLLFISFGLLRERFNWSRYKKLMSMSGRAVTDYYRIFGEGLMLVNMGIVGLMLTLLVAFSGIPLNGATVGSIISVMGFSAFGKNPKNIIPLILGCILMIIVSGTVITPSVLLVLIFVTGLAPIAGEFGFVIGIIAGILHFSLVQYTAEWQGGANLYNNGFAGGFIAGVISSIMDSIAKRSM